MIQRGKQYLIIVFLLFVGSTAHAQFNNNSKFLFVTPSYKSDCRTCNTIAEKIREEFVNTGAFYKLIYSRNLNATPLGPLYSNNVRYILRSNIEKYEEPDFYGITFSLDSIVFEGENESYRLENIEWNNNIYVITSDLPHRLVDSIVASVVYDLKHFELNKHLKVRIRVDEFKEPVEDIDPPEFSQWLTQILNEHNLIKQRYVFYYQYEIFPKEQKNKLYGKFKDKKPEDNLVLEATIRVYINEKIKNISTVDLQSDNYFEVEELKKKITDAVTTKLNIK